MSNFKVGTLVTGHEDNTYTWTDENSLMVITREINDDEYDIEVKIIASTRQICVGNIHNVNADEFYSTSFEDFFNRVPEAREYCLTDEELDVIKLDYGFTEFITIPTREKPEKIPYALSDKMRKQLIEEIKEFLETYAYRPTETAMNKILDVWALNNGDLIRAFEKDKHYNGKFQIQFDYDFDRTIDKQGSYKFAEYLKSLSVLFEAKIGCFTYHELRQICRRLDDITDKFIFNDYIKTINGKTYEEYQKEYDRFRKLKEKYFEYNDDIVIKGRNAYKREDYKQYEKLSVIINLLETSSYITQFVTESAANYIKCYMPEAKIKQGQRMSRAVNKLLSMLGIDKHPDYNKEFAKYADTVNPLKIKRHTVLSVHPIDYLSMSFGNSWTSCHSIDRHNVRDRDNSSGCGYSAGTLSYMLDGTSFVFYTVDGNYNGNHLELQDKINRNMFHYYDGQLVQGRVYPQSCDDSHDDLYKDIREIVQKVMADILEVPNLWTLKKGTRECSKAITTKGRHYPDYLHFNNCNVSILKDTTPYWEIEVGHNAICPCCGKEHDYRSHIECCDCY